MTGFDSRWRTAVKEAGARVSRFGFDASLMAFAAVLLAPTVGYPVGVDAAVFTAVADGVAHGLTPYLDLWDHKPPGIYALGAAAVRLFSLQSAWPALWAGTVIAIGGTGILIKRMLAERHRLLVAYSVALLAVWTLASTPLALGGGHTETIAVLPLVAATCLVIRQPRPRWAVAAGALVGLAGVTSLQSLLVVPALLWLMGGWRSRVIAFLVGLITAFAVVAVWLMASGAMPAAYDALVTYNRAYASSSAGEESFATSTRAAATAVLVMAPLLLLSLVGLRGERSPLRWRLGGWLWVGSSLAVSVVVGRFYSHYATFLIPGLALLSGDGMENLLRSRQHNFSWYLRFVCLASAVGLAVLVDTQYGASFRATAARREGVIAEAAEYVALRTPSGAPVLVWGNTPEFYSISGRMPATKWTYVLPLLTPGYGETAAADLPVELQNAPPAVLIDSSGVASAPAAPGIVAVHPFGARDGRTLDDLRQLRAFVRTQYACQDPRRAVVVCIHRAEMEPSGGYPPQGTYSEPRSLSRCCERRRV